MIDRSRIEDTDIAGTNRNLFVSAFDTSMPDILAILRVDQCGREVAIEFGIPTLTIRPYLSHREPTENIRESAHVI